MADPQRAGSIETLGLDLGTSGGEWLFHRGGMVFGPAPATAVIEQLLAGDLDGTTPVGREGEPLRPLAQVPFFRVHLAKAEARWRVVAEKRAIEETAARRRRLRIALIGGGAALLGAGLAAAVFLVARSGGHGDLAEIAVDITPPLIGRGAAEREDELVEYIDGSSGEKRVVRRARAAQHAAPSPAPAAAAATADADGLATEARYDRSGIDRALRAQQPLLFPCLKEAAARDPELRGEVPFSFTIGNDGRVVKVWVDRAGYETGALFACLSEKAGRMKFPSFEGEQPTVSLAFRVR